LGTYPTSGTPRSLGLPRIPLPVCVRTCVWSREALSERERGGVVVGERET
jgi:hypothetical protein